VDQTKKALATLVSKPENPFGVRLFPSFFLIFEPWPFHG